MSSYDDSMDRFEIADDDSGSDFAASPPPAKKAKKSPVAKAPPKPKAVKAATAPKRSAAAATKQTTLKTTAGGGSSNANKKTTTGAAKKATTKKKPVVSDSDDDDDDDDDSDAENDARRAMAVDDDGDSDVPAAKPAKKAAALSKKSASETYQKLSQVEHVLKRPDTYIGSIEPQTQPMWVYDTNSKAMVYKNITFVPGLYKIFDEILVNAADNKRNDASMDSMKVVIDREQGLISCYNNGKGIPVEIHSKEGCYIPELIFGHLLSSSNYDDDEKKVTGGRNGYGAKLANIYSLEFTVETADKKSGKKYKQTWKDNMSDKGKPKITDNKKGEEWTKITFRPDFGRFGLPDGLTDDIESLLMKRVYDMAGTCFGVKVELNGERLKVRTFKQYVEMYTNAVNEIIDGKKKGKGKGKEDKSEAPVGASPGGTLDADGAPKTPIIYEKVSERWEIAFAPSEGQFQQVSFVNSIATSKGGTHVDYISKQLVDGIIESMSKKTKKSISTLKPFTVKSHLWVFINCLIENPQFDSQTKENMTLQMRKYGSTCSISDGFLKRVLNSGVMDSILNHAQFQQDQLMKKTDGHKNSRMLGIAKLDDANQAGTRNAKNCTLILTEGDSAKTFAISGLSVVGRDTYGVFPLRGKLLNVREATGKTLTENQEIQYLKKILGLQHGKAYTSVDSLRYGRLMVMTDQDHDGSHIKGLIINWLDHFFPGLLQIPGFLVEFITPIVRVTRRGKTLSFFTIPEYEAWKEDNDNGRGWNIKYFKGLGTSDAKLAKEYFANLKTHMLKFRVSNNEDRALIDMAFNKKKADDRKEWLRSFKPGTFLDQSIKEIPISDFINKELILFSMADNLRSIPSVVDGFKPGQRKVLFGCFKKGLNAEIKVAQLVGYIGEHSAYHHGEQSLAGTIVGLAQNFVGNNNINLLMPNGQFGTRLAGGKDHASARYIFTAISPITRTLFHRDDDAVLTYLNDDGQSIEPEWYIPILPMVLVNGSDGIGTGWSSAIPNYNPMDIVANLRRKMRGEAMEPMHPWFRGFRGIVEQNGPGRYTTTGIAIQGDDDTVEIFELPIRSWTNSYVEQLLAWSQATDKQPALVKDFTSQSTDTAVHLIVNLTSEGKALVKKEGLEKALKLTSSVTTSNMVCFDAGGKIKKYTAPEEIISDFYDVRLDHYMRRKNHLVSELTILYERLSNQARFIQMFIKGELKISGREHGDIVRDLRKKGFKPFPKVQKAVVAADPDASAVITAMELESDEDDDEALEEDAYAQAGSSRDFDYLLEMSISSLTAAKARRLLQQRDEKEKELNILLDLTPKKMWENDLNAFEAEWKAMLASDEAAHKASDSKLKGKGGSKAGAAKNATIAAAFAAAAAKQKIKLEEASAAMAAIDAAAAGRRSNSILEEGGLSQSQLQSQQGQVFSTTSWWDNNSIKKADGEDESKSKPLAGERMPGRLVMSMQASPKGNNSNKARQVSASSSTSMPGLTAPTAKVSKKPVKTIKATASGSALPAARPKKKLAKYEDSFSEDESDVDMTLHSDDDDDDESDDQEEEVYAKMRRAGSDEDSDDAFVIKKVGKLGQSAKTTKTTTSRPVPSEKTGKAQPVRASASVATSKKRIIELDDTEEEEASSFDQDESESDEDQSFVVKPRKR